jgi:hypothetical protein
MDYTALLQAGAISLGSQKFVVYEKTVNFVDTNRGAADTDRLITIPAGTLVLAVMAQVVTAEGGAGTFDIGDSGSATRFLANADANTAAHLIGDGGVGTTVGTVVPYFYATANYIKATWDAALDAAKIIVRVIGFTPAAS